jgi:hypothetical protein
LILVVFFLQQKRYLKFTALNDKYKFCSLINECIDDLNTFIDENDSNSFKEICYNQLLIIEALLKLYKFQKDKFNLLKHILKIIPQNVELIKWFMNYYPKELGIKHALQVLFDHLNIHSIRNDNLWLL